MRSWWICMALVSGLGAGCVTARARDQELGAYMCPAPSQLALDLARAGVHEELRRSVALAKEERAGGVERLHDVLHTVVPVLRHLPLKRPVVVNIAPSMGRRVDSVGAPLFGLDANRAVRRSGYYDFLDEQIHAADGEQFIWTLVHEMAHALVDQHVNFARLFGGADGDSDRLLALGALVEGDANLTAFSYARSLCDPGGLLHASEAELDDMFELWWTFRPTPAHIAELSEGVQAPAVKAHAGTHFAAHITRQGGWAQLESVYEHPPLSTEHILHPRKYLDGEDPPWSVLLPRLTTLSDWDLLAEDVMGELRVRLLFNDYGDITGAASGWGGDTFRLYGSEQGTTGVVWVSRWDSEQDAAEFADVFERMRGRRPNWLELPMIRQERPVIARHGTDVTILDGFPTWKAEGLLVELDQTTFRLKGREPAEDVPAPKVIRVNKKSQRWARLDLMTVGARDCRVSVDGAVVGYAPVVRAKVPRGWCTIEVRCGDGHAYANAHRLTRGRNVIVIRHEDWQ